MRYTDRYPSDVASDPRPGDMFTRDVPYIGPVTYTVREGGLCVAPPHGLYPTASAWNAKRMARCADVRYPRCLVEDPRPGDTYQRDGHHEEVMWADATEVHTIDTRGMTHVHTRDAWAAGAQTWTSCMDRCGGALHDPRPGDLATVTSRAFVAVRERLPGRVRVARVLDAHPRYVDLDTWPTVDVTLEAWAAARTDVLFPVLYVRAPRVVPCTALLGGAS